MARYVAMVLTWQFHYATNEAIVQRNCPMNVFELNNTRLNGEFTSSMLTAADSAYSSSSAQQNISKSLSQLYAMAPTFDDSTQQRTSSYSPPFRPPPYRHQNTHQYRQVTFTSQILLESIDRLTEQMTSGSSPEIHMMGAAQRRYAAVVARKHSALTQHSNGNVVTNPNQMSSAHALSSPDLLSAAHSTPDLISTVLNRYKLAVAKSGPYTDIAYCARHPCTSPSAVELSPSIGPSSSGYDRLATPSSSYHAKAGQIYYPQSSPFACAHPLQPQQPASSNTPRTSSYMRAAPKLLGCASGSLAVASFLPSTTSPTVDPQPSTSAVHNQIISTLGIRNTVGGNGIEGDASSNHERMICGEGHRTLCNRVSDSSRSLDSAHSSSRISIVEFGRFDNDGL
uniref:Uncharacterized protein n=1 Tax=Parascaris equorum TaxID=6256 RepID=A0A914RS02_PAREQ